MKDLRLVTILGVIILLIGSFTLGRCSKEDKEIVKTVKINVPESRGSFESPQIIKPESNDIKTAIKIKDSLIYIPQVNQELFNKYLALESENNSNKKEIEKLSMYADAIAIRTYKNKFENKDISFTVESKVEGKLLDIKIPEYIRKEFSSEVDINIPKPKERILSVNLGAGLSTTKQLEKFEPSVHLDIIGKNYNILSAGIGTEGTITAKYTINIFNIKK